MHALIPSLVVPALALVLAGCGGGSPATSEDEAVDTSTASAATPAAGATAASTVRLLAHDSFVLSEDLIAELQAETGITLEIISGSDAGTMVAGAVLAAGSPTADVIFGVDNTLLSRAVDAGVFEPYTSPELAAVVPELREDTAGGVVTPIDYGDVCINIDDSSLEAAGVPAPETLDDLIDPRYRDMLVVQDPGTSSPGLAFLLATIARYGDGWTNYWAALRENGVSVAGSWTDAYYGEFSGGGEGTRPLVVSYATSPPAEIVYAEDPKPEVPSTSVMTDGCYRQVEYAGVLAGTDAPDGARAVIDWLLSSEVQTDVPLSMFVFPAREGVVLPDVFTRFAADVEEPLALPADEVAANLTGWLSEWGTVMGR
jgi:thiamine transport system substrate-binding protein